LLLHRISIRKLKRGTGHPDTPAFDGKHPNGEEGGLFFFIYDNRTNHAIGDPKNSGNIPELSKQL
jgi:hypothetical protein